MTINGWLQIALFCAVILALAAPVGGWLHAVYQGRRRWLGPVESAIYRTLGVDPDEDQHWTRYAASVLVFSAVSMLATYGALRMQGLLPLNPAALPGVADRQAFETASAFTTNTNWQSYSGESTMSYFSQMTQLAFHNFVSAAVGMGVAFALARGIAAKSGGRLGSFWADLVRGTLYVFLPLCIMLALVLVSRGVIQNLKPYEIVTTVEGARQTIAMGPVASQEAIKQIGTNGGGFFNANSAHPFENPTPFTNLLSMLAILLIPAGLVNAYGRVIGRPRHAWAILAAMGILFVAGTAVTYAAEAAGNPIHAARGIDVAGILPGHAAGNMEGKETRFGVAGSALYAAVTTAASCGAVNAMHDSFTPLGGLIPMVNMQLGEIVFGGVGAGLYGMLVFVVLTVFLAGLMVGRTPEYLGKRLGSREVRMAMLYILAFPAVVLLMTALASVTESGLSARANTGPHGLSEILYAFTSAAANNGSAFAGLSGGSVFYNTLLGMAMLLGRFALIVPVLALGGFMGERGAAPETAGSFPVDTPLFVGLLVSVVLIVGALTWFPVLALGPLAEHFLMNAGRMF
jgi:K+-transporting ATPase ATPase A chain